MERDRALPVPDYQAWLAGCGTRGEEQLGLDWRDRTNPSAGLSCQWRVAELPSFPEREQCRGICVLDRWPVFNLRGQAPPLRGAAIIEAWTEGVKYRHAHLIKIGDLND